MVIVFKERDKRITNRLTCKIETGKVNPKKSPLYNALNMMLM